MPRYVRKNAIAEATQHTGDDWTALEAAARLGGEPAPDGRYFQHADGVSPNRGFAFWNRKKGSWDIANKGDWVVVDVDGARKMRDEDFTAQYVRAVS